MHLCVVSVVCVGTLIQSTLEQHVDEFARGVTSLFGKLYPMLSVAVVRLI